MLSQQHAEQCNSPIIAEIQELKRKIDEVKKANITRENSLVLQSLDTQLSEMLKNHAFQVN